ncbi:MAG: pentapeptide repeat-containing protein [Gemmatimonadetes bacterium]|nr:pentapeptide repeat-containing protein [Gemmatimonadota bacterium]
MTALSFVLVAVLVFLLVLFLATGSGCDIIVDFLGESSKNGAMSFIGVAMGGTLLALNAVASQRRARAMEEAAKAQAKGTKAQADAIEQTERGRRQERFKHAIEHLGDKSAAVRLGGAYELFHLAKDTKELGQTALDILCAHIRQTTYDDEYRREHQGKPSLEIQDLLTLIFVQEADIFGGLRIDLHACWLNGADLRKAKLWNANLRGSHFFNARLSDARLDRADLVQADLRGGILRGASLREARLFDARMQSINLEGANLQGADLCGVKLTAAYLRNAQLQAANLANAQMYGASLGGAGMQGSTLSWTYLQGATFSGTAMQGAGTVLHDASNGFAQRVMESVGKDTDGSQVVSGGLARETVRQLAAGVEEISSDNAEILREQLRPYIEEPHRTGIPAVSGIMTGTYTEAEAKEWIAEHKKVMSESEVSEMRKSRRGV